MYALYIHAYRQVGYCTLVVRSVVRSVVRLYIKYIKCSYQRLGTLETMPVYGLLIYIYGSILCITGDILRYIHVPILLILMYLGTS